MFSFYSQFLSIKVYLLCACFSVSYKNVIHGPIVVSNEYFADVDASLANERAWSAVNMQPVELSNDHYDELWVSVVQIADQTIPLRTIYSSDVERLAVSMQQLVFNYRKGMIASRFFPECKPKSAGMKDVIGEEGVQNVMKEWFRLTLFNGPRRCSTVHQLKVELGHERISRPLRVIWSTWRDGWAAEKAKEIRLLWVLRTFSMVVCMDRRFLFVMEAVSKNTRVSEIHYDVCS